MDQKHKDGHYVVKFWGYDNAPDAPSSYFIAKTMHFGLHELHFARFEVYEMVEKGYVGGAVYEDGKLIYARGLIVE